MADPAFADFRLTRRPALGGMTAHRSGGLTLESRQPGAILHLLAAAGQATRPDIDRALGLDSDYDLRFAGPGQWLLVSGEPLDAQDIGRRLFGVAKVVDQSHGRSAIRLAGLYARDVLAKGTGVDLASDAFPIGHSAMTLIGHIGANLARTGEHEFELLVLRGFAESLWHDLEIMSAEFRHPSEPD